MSEPAKKFDVGGLLPQDASIKEIKIEAPEDPDGKKLRLRKEFWTWVAKDLAAHAVSFLFVLIIGIYCFAVVARYGVASPEAKLVCH
jgi:hypothetical protein